MGISYTYNYHITTYYNIIYVYIYVPIFQLVSAQLSPFFFFCGAAQVRRRGAAAMRIFWKRSSVM